MKSNHKSLFTNTSAEAKKLNASLVEELPVLSEKFFTFSHEGISMMWRNEAQNTPIRGIRSNQK